MIVQSKGAAVALMASMFAAGSAASTLTFGQGHFAFFLAMLQLLVSGGLAFLSGHLDLVHNAAPAPATDWTGEPIEGHPDLRQAMDAAAAGDQVETRLDVVEADVQRLDDLVAHDGRRIAALEQRVEQVARDLVTLASGGVISSDKTVPLNPPPLPVEPLPAAERRTGGGAQASFAAREVEAPHNAHRLPADFETIRRDWLGP